MKDCGTATVAKDQYRVTIPRTAQEAAKWLKKGTILNVYVVGDTETITVKNAVILERRKKP